MTKSLEKKTVSIMVVSYQTPLNCCIEEKRLFAFAKRKRRKSLFFLNTHTHMLVLIVNKDHKKNNTHTRRRLRRDGNITNQ